MIVARWNNIGGEFLTRLNENNEFEYGPIAVEYVLASDHDRVVAELRNALDILYRETADYITRNKLGDVHHNLSMQLARAALKDSP